MEQIRKIIRKCLFESYFENTSKPGEYSTEEMNYFLLKLIDLVHYSNKPEVYEIKKSINIPSSWPSSSVSNTGEEAIQNWEKSKVIYTEPDTKWYVWKVDVGGSLNKPKQFSAQRFDFESILKIIEKSPESFRSISIGVENELTRNQEKNISTKGD